MLVASGQREIVFQRYCGDPNIVLRNKLSEPCQVSVDSAVVVRCPFIGCEDGTQLHKILNLLETLGFETDL